MEKPDLIFTIGIPGSGKSWWIKSKSGYEVISPDSIRAELSDVSDQSIDFQAWTTAKERVRKALEKGKNVILDATNLTASGRSSSKDRKWFVEGLPPHNLKARIFDVDPEVAKKRIKDDIEKGRNRSKVPEDVIDIMYNDFKKTVPNLNSEGFEIISSDISSHANFLISASTGIRYIVSKHLAILKDF